jgi:hypothetical protein
MIVVEVAIAAMLICAAVPAFGFVINLRRYRLPRFGPSDEPLAVLVPARDEEMTIYDCLQSVLASRDVKLEVIVLDDDSADRTVQIVQSLMKTDPRVKLVRSAGLPRGWNGKQHACWLLAHETDAPVMLFLDADVRVHPWALARCVAAKRTKKVALLSGFPRQITVGFAEWILLPLIHFVLLGFLPMGRMRKTTKPSYAAGCGQFLMVEREAYLRSGGHAAIRETRHDGLRLPRLFREHGFSTDIVDLTPLVEVRMYRSAHAVWQGLAKNATEGLGAPGRILQLSFVLFVGQVLPYIAAILWLPWMIRTLATHAAIAWMDDPAIDMAIVTFGVLLSVLASALPRLLAVRRFVQPLKSAVLHPLGVTLLLLIQWTALARQIAGSPVSWRERLYASGSGEEI